MMKLEQDIKAHIEKIASAENAEALDQLRVEALGRKGFMTAALAQLGVMPKQARAQMGADLNRLKADITNALGRRKKEIEARALEEELGQMRSDISLAALPSPAMAGRLHPVWQVMDEVIGIFARFGFAYEAGPDIESEYYNFTALNIGADHPARQSHDSFFFPPNQAGEAFCLRTHTSPVQIRVMEQSAPPFRFIAPGRVYRRDFDQTHTPMFHQIEGVAIDRDIHLGHLKWVLVHFLRVFFENDEVEIRLRPHYFPFTEPSLEVDMRVDRNTPWLEIAGCGMVHPKVLAHCGMDGRQFQGFAFGFGIDRLAMLKYGIEDLRRFFDSDLSWLNHYGFPLTLTLTTGGSR